MYDQTARLTARIAKLTCERDDARSRGGRLAAQATKLTLAREADQEKIDLAVKTLYEEINQLENWAAESLAGGWSTHQVKPQQKRAEELARVVVTLTHK